MQNWFFFLNSAHAWKTLRWLKEVMHWRNFHIWGICIGHILVFNFVYLNNMFCNLRFLHTEYMSIYFGTVTSLWTPMSVCWLVGRPVGRFVKIFQKWWRSYTSNYPFGAIFHFLVVFRMVLYDSSNDAQDREDVR